MTTIDEAFHEYFEALDRSGNEDRCFLCRRTSAEVKTFFGFHEDGTPMDADRYGIEDVVLTEQHIMSYRGARPICAICQLNYEMIFLAGDHTLLRRVLGEIEEDRDRLWPERRPRETDAET